MGIPLAFALGAFPAYADAAGTGYDNLTYFVGSLFFTSAAFLQYCQVVSTPGRRRAAHPRLSQPDRIDWWASAIQLVGTLFFNLSTGRALSTGLAGPTNINHTVWRPDALGS